MKTWKGTYTYEKAPENLVGKTLPFELKFDLSDGSFSGDFIEEEFNLLTEQGIKVNGFFEEDYVSFVVTYPFRRVYKEDGSPVLQTEIIDQEVTFYGEFEEGTQKIVGNWEIIFQTHIGTQGINLVAANGPFVMEEVE